MKLFLQIALVLFYLNSAAQQKEIKVTKEKIAASKIMSDFISDLPADCKISSYFFSAGIKSHVKEFTVNGNGLPPEVKSLINNIEKGKPFYIEKLKCDCKTLHKNNFKIIVE